MGRFTPPCRTVAPGNSQSPARWVPAGRRVIRIFPPRSITAATTSIVSTWRRSRGLAASAYCAPAGTENPKKRAALSPSTFARCASLRRDIVRSMASAEWGHVPSWCG